MNVTERAKSQRLNVKFTQAEHDDIVRRAGIAERVRLAIEYDKKSRILTLRPSVERGSNVLSKAGGNWAFIVSFDGFQRTVGEALLVGKDLRLDMTLSEKCEIKIPIISLIAKDGLANQSNIAKIKNAIDLINQSIKDGLNVELKRGFIVAKL